MEVVTINSYIKLSGYTGFDKGFYLRGWDILFHIFMRELQVVFL